jgi:hypothetical protein
VRRRLQDRCGKLLKAGGWEASDRLDLRTHCPRAGDGGLQLIGEWLSDNRGGLVLLDTLGRFRDVPTGRVNPFQEDYGALAALKTLADTYAGAVLAVHHTKKLRTDDPLDSVSGTLGINAAADTLLILERGRADGGGTMFVTGRDVPEATLTMTFDSGCGMWAVVDSTDGIERPGDREPGPTRVEACAAWLRAFVGPFAWPDSEVEEAARKQGYTTDNIRKAKTLLRAGRPPLVSRPAYRGGPWWNWVGEVRPPDRPCISVHHSPQTTTTTADSSDSSV